MGTKQKRRLGIPKHRNAGLFKEKGGVTADDVQVNIRLKDKRILVITGLGIRKCYLSS